MTLDVDAQLIETNKADAKLCYDGYKAFQPVQVSWAETLLVLADEFRDGNVPAGKDMVRVVAFPEPNQPPNQENSPRFQANKANRVSIDYQTQTCTHHNLSTQKNPRITGTSRLTPSIPLSSLERGKKETGGPQSLHLIWEFECGSS